MMPGLSPRLAQIAQRVLRVSRGRVRDLSPQRNSSGGVKALGLFKILDILGLFLVWLIAMLVEVRACRNRIQLLAKLVSPPFAEKEPGHGPC